MTSPNFDALERISAAHHVLATHQELPALLDFSYVSGEKVHVGLSDAAAVDAYAEAFRIHKSRRDGWLDNGDGRTWTYLRSDDRYLFIARSISQPLPPLEAETADDSGPDRVAVTS